MKKIIMALMCICMSLAMSAQPNNNKEESRNKPKTGKKYRPYHHNRNMNGYRLYGQQCQCGHFHGIPQRMHNVRPAKNDMIVNMQTIRTLGLDSTKVNAVKELKKRKTEEMRAIRMTLRPNRPMADASQDNKDKALDKKEKKADKKRMKKGDKAADKKKETLTPEEKKERRGQFMAKMKESREKMQACAKSYRTELRTILGDEKYIEYLEKLSTQRQQAQNFRQPRAHKFNKR